MTKLRPQVMAAILILGIITIVGVIEGVEPLAVGAATGIVALAKDVITNKD